MMPRRLQRIAPILILLGLMALAYLPLFFGQVLFQRDVCRQLFPESAYLARIFTQGRAALWNPTIGLGIATLSNPLNELFYPPALLLFTFHSPRALSLFLFAHLVSGAVGMALLVRRLRPLGTAPPLIAGLAWGLSGYCTSEMVAGLRTIAGSYLPWCALGLLGLSRAIAARQPVGAWARPAALTALAFGLCFLTGELFFPMLAAGFAGVVALGDAMDRRRTCPDSATLASWSWRLALAFAGALVLAAGLGALALVPAARAAKTTAREAPLARTVAEVGSLHPWRIAEMLAPGAMGDARYSYPAGAWIGEPELGQRPLLYGVYLGSSVVLLASFALGRRRRLATALAATAVLAVLIAMGRHAWVHAAVRALVPPLRYMRGPEKYLVLAQAALAVLAGLGLARALEGERTLWRRGGGLGLILLGLWASGWLVPPVLAPQLRASALLALACVAACLVLTWLVSRRPQAAAGLLVAVVFVDLALAVLALQSFGPPSLLSDEPAAARAVLDEARARGELAPPRVYRAENVDAAIEQARPPRSVEEVQRNLTRTLIDNHAGVFGIASVPGYDAALPKSFQSLWLSGRAELGLDLLRVTGVGFLIGPASLPPQPGLHPMMDPVPGARLFRVERALPRLYAARVAATLPDADLLPALSRPEIVAGRAVLLSPVGDMVAIGARGGMPASDPSAPAPGACHLTAYSAARIEGECAMVAPGVAVFLEQLDPSWSATVDGKPAAIAPANLAMRAVPVDAGLHKVVLSWAAPLPGLKLELAALVALALLLLIGRGARSRSAHEVAARAVPESPDRG